MKRITTKKGDKGYTCLWHNDIISKSSLKIEVIGKIDELIAWISVCRSFVETGKLDISLDDLQNILSNISGDLVGWKGEETLKDHHIPYVDQYIEILDEYVKLPNHWVFSGTTVTNHLNYARALARECERKVVELLNQEQEDFKSKFIKAKDLSDPDLIVFFNRLSDLFYLLMLEAGGDIK